MKIRPTLLVAGSLGVGLSMASGAMAQGTAASERHVYFGDLHLHTTMSLDAWSNFGTKTTPDEAYRFAKGQTVAWRGHPMKRGWPLDFTAVTDHSELMGVLAQLDDPNSMLTKSDFGEQLLQHPAAVFGLLRSGRIKQMEGYSPELLNAAGAMQSAWKIEQKAANDNYEPGKFTTFIAYEWSSQPDGKNLHRNVFFNSSHAPMPFTATQSNKPEDLWTYLESVRAQGIDCLAIPHNADASSGLMFDWNDSSGKPIDTVYASRRALNEPLTEIVQNKGQSDTDPELSANDEFANFELWERLLASPDVHSAPNGSYVRQAYGRGLIIQSRVGANPFKYGIVGATDFHNGFTTSDEKAFAGALFGIDPNTALPDGDEAKEMLGLAPIPGSGNANDQRRAPEKFQTYSSGGLTGVWAEENTRASLFAALKRKETFATSGPRMRVRFFGGWNFDEKILNKPDWPSAAYTAGVPMGADLPAKPAGAPAPQFAVSATKDPDSGNLDRVQIIKVWLEGGDYKEKIFDVAFSGARKIDPKTGKLAPVGNTVDVKTGTYTNTIGASELAALWQDPEFDAAVPAVYYVRALEIPTPRWTTLLAVKRNLPLPADEPATIQERAWASPIWYTPQSR